jgi:ABC-type transport system substrate-binding protein
MRRFAPPFPITMTSLVALLLPLALAGCGEDKGAVEIMAIGNAEAMLGAGGRLTPAGQIVRGATAEGLVALGQNGQVVPALAERWIVTDDGLSYIFRLRSGNWPDGSEITADTALASLRQAIAALRGTPLGLDLASITQSRAMTGRVIELTLARPQPELLQLLAQPELGLLRKGRGTGPMLLKRDGAKVTLTLIAPEKRGQTAIPDWDSRIRRVHLSATSADKAIAGFRRGEVSAVLAGGFADLPLAGASGLPASAFQFDPVQGLFGLAFVHQDGFLAKLGNREAIAMAIDRDALASALAVNGWTGSTRLMPGSPAPQADPDQPAWDNQPLAERRSEAATRIKRSQSSKPGAAEIQLRIAMPQGPGADRLFARVSDDLGQIGVKATRVAEGSAADLRLVEVVARYAGVQWYFNQFACANQRWVCSPEADKLVISAHQTSDAAERDKLLAEAEAKLAASSVFIPFGPPVRWSLVRNGTTGFAVNRYGYHPLMPLALLPK